ncbi:transporter substrate-binding domain-containing protein [Bradyrhizobium sp. C-145]|uniref:transporter substrate-binding domain-containing protein n=1 Tax=Bradyrhizobium sp. C-145 TaxID=574727 RepID=UPI00201B4DE4|nr:transporter substrate-binding domain-containing protein [Bradyrhizobium sp. C-145]UQR61461.1 transporter substrate-binding domain-containing protein [Bradyrhizobium sp. C-145]
MPFKIAIRISMSGLSAASLSAGAAFAQSSPKVITAGDLVTYPPFAYKDRNTGESGFDRDIFEAMAQKVGATVKWEFFSWTDLTSFAPLKTGRDLAKQAPRSHLLLIHGLRQQRPSHGASRLLQMLQCFSGIAAMQGRVPGSRRSCSVRSWTITPAAIPFDEPSDHQEKNA